MSIAGLDTLYAYNIWWNIMTSASCDWLMLVLCCFCESRVFATRQAAAFCTICLCHTQYHCLGWKLDTLIMTVAWWCLLASFPPCCACDSFDEVESSLNLHLSNIKYTPAVPFCLLRTRQHCQQGFGLFFVLDSEPPTLWLNHQWWHWLLLTTHDGVYWRKIMNATTRLSESR